MLAGLHVCGFPVFGGSRQLGEVYEKQPFDKLLVTTRGDDPEKMRQLAEFCRRHNIVLSKLVIGEKTVVLEDR